MAVQENIGAGSIYAVKIKATFDNTHISLCGRTGCGYTCIYCLGNGRINFALQYNLQKLIEPKITPHNNVCDDNMHTVQWWIQGREAGGSFPPYF